MSSPLLEAVRRALWLYPPENSIEIAWRIAFTMVWGWVMAWWWCRRPWGPGRRLPSARVK